MPGQKNVSGITAIQHSLRDVDSRSCKIRFVVNVGDSIDRPTVNSHPQLNERMLLQGFADLEAHRVGSSRLRKKSSAIPSPIGTRLSLPLASADRKHAVLRTMWFNSWTSSITSSASIS